MKVKHKRTREEILNDIMLIVLNRSGRIKRTQLMTKANLSYKLMNQYLEDLINQDYIDFVNRNNHQYIIITDKGREFLDRLLKVQSFKETMGLD